MLLANGKVLCKMNNNIQRASGSILKSTTGSNATIDTTNNVYNQVLTNLELFVGTGTSQPVSTDYQDITNVNAGLTTVVKTGTNNDSVGNYNQNYIAIFTKTYRNDTESDITVSEVAIRSYANNNMSIKMWDVIIARDVLSTPVTIAPGEAYTFTMYIG